MRDMVVFAREDLGGRSQGQGPGVPHSCGPSLVRGTVLGFPRGGPHTKGTPACPTQGSLVTLVKCLLLCRPQFLLQVRFGEGAPHSPGQALLGCCRSTGVGMELLCDRPQGDWSLCADFWWPRGLRQTWPAGRQPGHVEFPVLAF